MANKLIYDHPKNTIKTSCYFYLSNWQEGKKYLTVRIMYEFYYSQIVMVRL